MWLLEEEFFSSQNVRNSGFDLLHYETFISSRAQKNVQRIRLSWEDLVADLKCVLKDTLKDRGLKMKLMDQN